MAQLLIRDLPERTVRRLKARAKSSGRSLSAEVRLILQCQADTLTMDEARQQANRLRRKLADRGLHITDSTDLIREDRDR